MKAEKLFYLFIIVIYSNNSYLLNDYSAGHYIRVTNKIEYFCPHRDFSVLWGKGRTDGKQNSELQIKKIL